MDRPIDKISRDFSGKKVLVMGLGLLGGGAGVAKFMVDIGARVRVTDQKDEELLKSVLKELKGKPITFTLGRHLMEDVDWAEVIIRNPAIRQDNRWLAHAYQQGKSVHMDAQLFLQYAGVKTVGITGTRGKSTTTQMILEILVGYSGKQVILGGNVAGKATLPLIEKVKDPSKAIAVLELSSWQLQSFHDHKISPDIAVLTNLYPDHLNTYPSMEEYAKDKQAIIRYQKAGDLAVLNRQHNHFSGWPALTPAKVHWYDKNQLPKGFRLTLPGDHNLENAAAAYRTAMVMGIGEDDILECLADFRGMPYRLQQVAEYRGIKIINDTTSTTPIATQMALASFKVPKVLILGGSDKNLPLADLAEQVNRLAKGVVLISGIGTDRIKPLINPSKIVTETDSLDIALAAAINYALPGEVVLFSPGFTSFGLFDNEFDRGEKFNRAVERRI